MNAALSKEKILSMIKDKKSYNIQKSLFDFINNSNLSEKISRKEDIYKLIDHEIIELSSSLMKLFQIEVDYNNETISNIHEAFESLISKSLHNYFIMAYEQDDIRFKRLLNKINETVLAENKKMMSREKEKANNFTVIGSSSLYENEYSLEKFLKVDEILIEGEANEKNDTTVNQSNLLNINDINSELSKNKEEKINIDELLSTKKLLKIATKFREDLYYYQSAREKLICVNQLFYNIKTEILKMDSYLEFENSKPLRRLLSYILVKADINRVYSNLQFIKAFKLLSSMSSQEQFFLNILINSVKRLKLKLKKYYSFYLSSKSKKNTSSHSDGNSSNEEKEKEKDKNESNESKNEFLKGNFSYYSYEIKKKEESKSKKSANKDYKNQGFFINKIQNISKNIFFPGSNLKDFEKEYEEDEDVITDNLNMNQNSQTIMQIDTERIRRDYFLNEFNNLSEGKFESMCNDFKITLKLIESFKVSLDENFKSEKSK